MPDGDIRRKETNDPSPTNKSYDAPMAEWVYFRSL